MPNKIEVHVLEQEYLFMIPNYFEEMAQLSDVKYAG